MMKKFALIFSIAIIAITFNGCDNQSNSKNVDVSEIKSEIRLLRFEQDFATITNENYDQKTAELRSKYGSFYDDYTQTIMAFGSGEQIVDTAQAIRQNILAFLSNQAIKGLYDTVNKNYNDLKDIERDLNLALRHLYYYFPDKKFSSVYTFISEFSYGSITYSDSILAIGLDMYLGEQYPFYESFDIPKFIIRKLNRNYIVPNCMEVIYQLYFDKQQYNAELPLIEAMVQEGKKLYFLERMMPDAPDSLIIGYTEKQARWCKDSEKQIWQFFTSKDLLYSTNFMEQRRYTTDGPSTSGMPSESPGKVGVWVGWQIVRKYMVVNEGKVSLNELLTNTDTKTIIAKAKYKP
jgi:hypothetical protein